MGFGFELVLFVLVILLFLGFIIFRYSRKGAMAAPTNRDPRGTAFLRWLLPALGVGLVALIAINLQFCHQQQNTRMEKNTRENNSLDNVGKGENEDNHQGAGDNHRDDAPGNSGAKGAESEKEDRDQ
ncbi:hypothetical protein [Tellurirhabdus rosea]|uniref:hypothetical protein n=1 Tax=Tellurirhabdus rosea TaxID=2674997 RepID=UPI00224ECBC8|nr:hypothetical protein [Tellurirhabdus rosea]